MKVYSTNPAYLAMCTVFTTYLVDYTVKLLETDGLLISLDLAHYLVLAREKTLVVSLAPVKLNFPTIVLVCNQVALVCNQVQLTLAIACTVPNMF